MQEQILFLCSFYFQELSMEKRSKDDEEYYYRAVHEKQFLCLLSVCHGVCQFENFYFSVNYKLSVTYLHSYLEEQNCFSIMFVYLFIGYRIYVNVKMKYN